MAARFEEGETVRVVSTENGLYVGEEYEIAHVGVDPEGETLYVLEVPLSEPWASVTPGGTANAGFYEEQLGEVG